VEAWKRSNGPQASERRTSSAGRGDRRKRSGACACVSWPHICGDNHEHARQGRTDVEDRLPTPSMAGSVQRQAADPAVVVIVLERRGDDAFADTSARRERRQIGTTRRRSRAVEDGRRGCGIRASIFDTSGDRPRRACGSESRKANDEADADVDATGAVEHVVDAMKALRPRPVVATGNGGVEVAMLVGTDGRGCVGARFGAGLVAGGAGKAPGLRSASGEPEPVEPSAVWYGPSETGVPAELAVGGMPCDGAGWCRRRRRRRCAQEEVAVRPAIVQIGGRRAVVFGERRRRRAGRGG
jgi:hypothetical protein